MQRLSRFLVTSLVLLMVLSLVPTNSWAQEEQLEFKDLKVDVWPEYDDPRVLVILQGTLVNTSTTPFSGKINWNIPKASDLEIGMACEIVNGGGHSCQPYEQADKGEWIELTWRTTHEIEPGEEYPVFLEYYYNPLEGDVEKTFNFPYQPSYDIGSLSLTVKEPSKATDFKIDPEPSSTNVDGNGFTNYNYLYNDQTSEDNINLNVSYTKEDPNPSVEKQVGDGNTDQQSPGLQATSSWKDAKVWIPAGFMVLIMGGFLGYAVIQNRDKQQAERIARINKKAKNTSPNSQLAKEKKKLRQKLLNGIISEETYHELLAEIEEEYGK